MWRYTYNLRGLYETPVLRGEGDAGARSRRGATRSSTTCATPAGRMLTEVESKQLLAAYGIPTVQTRDRADAKTRRVAAADEIGYPVVLKLLFGNHHAQDRRGRRATEPARRRRGAKAFRAIRSVGHARRLAPSTFRASPCSRWSSSTATN